MKKMELIHQTKLAFDFIEKLYLEISYLIKEIEGLLAEEEESFIIGRTGGYQITTRSSSGLEPANVNYWSLKKMSVFFVSKELSKYTGALTQTPLTNELKVIYLRIVVDERDIPEPYINVGVLWNINSKSNAKISKFEHIMAHIEYRENKVFNDQETLDYEDGLLQFKKKLFKVGLYEINSTEDILRLLVTPTLKIYREK
jgi:hypothetical protein